MATPPLERPYRGVFPVAPTVFDDNGALVGISPENGEILWKVDNAIGQNAVPTKVTLDGQEGRLWTWSETRDFIQEVQTTQGSLQQTPWLVCGWCTSSCTS